MHKQKFYLLLIALFVSSAAIISCNNDNGSQQQVMQDSAIVPTGTTAVLDTAVMEELQNAGAARRYINHFKDPKVDPYRTTGKHIELTALLNQLYRDTTKDISEIKTAYAAFTDEDRHGDKRNRPTLVFRVKSRPRAKAGEPVPAVVTTTYYLAKGICPPPGDCADLD